MNIVKQVRNHPSIVEWIGGNEMPWKNGDPHPALRLLEKVVREEDGRIFRSTEPAQGSGAHGSYTYVYHTEPAPYLSWLGAGSQNLYQRYDTSAEMRLSEFGTHSPANLEVWQRTMPPASQWPLTNYSDPVLIRKNVFWGAVLKENWLHKEITERLFGPLPALEQLVPAGQFLGAEGLRYAMDALRRKGPALGGGFMSWNYNEPWPNGAGSYMVDYDGRPLMNYDFVRQALAPVSLSLKYPSLLYDPDQGGFGSTLPRQRCAGDSATTPLALAGARPARQSLRAGQGGCRLDCVPGRDSAGNPDAATTSRNRARAGLRGVAPGRRSGSDAGRASARICGQGCGRPAGGPAAKWPPGPG